ncbi:maleylpyruvate isomerase N-terminal domain-containing protein [Luteococcus sanguinis]|uniref:Maleylpyruvate isomerase N-terminal domain-containing protein n=1 Tax=Luteococcus sanguinis TaxID=174038 RepID=A0ABW1X2T3_9ACTN
MSDNQPTIGQRHRAAAYEFTEKVDQTRDWDAPTPVKEWTARDVVRHLVEWPRQLTASAVTWGEVPSVDDDPAGAWHAHTDEVQALLDDPASVQLLLDSEHFGQRPVTDVLEEFYLPDVFMHTWDLARSQGITADLDPVVAEALFRGMEQQEEMLRSSGQFGERQEVRPGASYEEQLVALIGRDPAWIRPRV